jgi:hypothetical protein
MAGERPLVRCGDQGPVTNLIRTPAYLSKPLRKRAPSRPREIRENIEEIAHGRSV